MDAIPFQSQKAAELFGNQRPGIGKTENRGLHFEASLNSVEKPGLYRQERVKLLPRNFPTATSAVLVIPFAAAV